MRLAAYVAGHGSSTMLYKYKRRARHAEELGITPPGSLLEGIPELRGELERSGLKSAADRAKKPNPLPSVAEVAEWQTQRIQNPPSERA